MAPFLHTFFRRAAGAAAGRAELQRLFAAAARAGRVAHGADALRLPGVWCAAGLGAGQGDGPAGPGRYSGFGTGGKVIWLTKR